MSVDLLQEKIAHLQTRQQLWAAQSQVLDLLRMQAAAEMTTLQTQLADAQAAPA